MEKIKVVLLNGESVDVSFPTDEQWQYRARKRRVVQRTVRGETAIDVEGNEEVDLEIFREISGLSDYSDGPEAALALERLADSDVVKIERTAEGFSVTLATYAGEQEYIVGRLSAGQLQRYRKIVSAVSDRSGKTVLQTNLEIPARIFNELAATEALRAGTSIIYKAAVMSAIVGEAQRLLEASNRPS